MFFPEEQEVYYALKSALRSNTGAKIINFQKGHMPKLFSRIRFKPKITISLISIF